MPKARRETFLRRVVRTAIGANGTVSQDLSCGHFKYVLALELGKGGVPVLPKSRYCDECAVAAGRRHKRKAA